MQTGTARVLDGRWRLGAVLGRGGNAAVFEATDERRLQRGSVAVKVVRAPDATTACRFDRELVALAVVDHPNVVRMLDHGVDGDDLYVVLEWVQGGCLAAALESGPLGPARAAAVGADVAAALGAAHQRGVVHRDVKPSNVLLDGGGRPKLNDFGIAVLQGAGALTDTGMTVGTAAYLSPEQVRGERARPASDVYALGLVVLEAATGERAFPGSSAEAAYARLARDPEVPASVPPPLRALLVEMTAADPAARPSAAVAAERLRAAAGALEATTTSQLPVAATVTGAIPVVREAPPPVAPPVAPVAAVAPVPVPLAAEQAARRWVLGFLAAVAVLTGLAFADGAGTGPDPGAAKAPPVALTTTTAAPTTTAPPPPPDDDDDDDDEGRGNGRGGGRGRGRGNDDD